MAAPTEEISRNNWFYARWAALGTDYDEDQSRDFSNSMNNLKIIATGGAVVFSLSGADNSRTEGRILAGESITFEGCSVHKIAIKEAAGTVTDLRIWAYS